MRAPADLGFPSFASWRPGQLDALLAAASSDKPYVVLCQPTGSGKSLTYMAVAALLDWRTAILTATKGLQDQIGREFRTSGLVDLRGQANYLCNLDTELRVPEGPCMDGMRCELRDGGCTYYDQLRRAQASRLLVTNYAKWLVADDLGPRDLLVLDEAHSAPEVLLDFLALTLNEEAMDLIGEPPPATGYREWAKRAIEHLKCALDRETDSRTAARLKARVRRLTLALGRLAGAKSEDQWVRSESREGVRFDVVWPAEFAPWLFRGSKRVILTSATVVPKTLSMLGLKPEQYEFLESESTFPTESRYVTWLPTARIDKRAGQEQYGKWLARIDEIVEGRLDRKGIIHTVSYDRAKLILQSSKMRRVMLYHDRHTARQVVERFKAMPPPAVLVSPTVDTGYNFPDDELRYQIISKVAFPDTRSPVMKRRSELDKEYPMYLAMQSLVQAAGRGNRSEQDWCETFVIDDNVQWFFNRWKKFAPQSFRQAFRRRVRVPEPPAAAS